MDGVLVKPVDAGRLRRAVKDLLASTRLTAAESAAATDAAGEAEDDELPEPVELAP